MPSLRLERLSIDNQHYRFVNISLPPIELSSESQPSVFSFTNISCDN